MRYRQGDMTVAEYIRRFDRGCHFVPLIANDAAEKLRHFTDGLQPTIHRDVLMMDPADYAAATTRAFRAEQALKDIDQEMQRKRQQSQSSQQPSKKSFTGLDRVQGSQKPLPIAASKKDEKPLCKECNRQHYGKCMWGTFRCFICKEEGHKAGDYPKKDQPRRLLSWKPRKWSQTRLRVQGIDSVVELGFSFAHWVLKISRTKFL